MAGLQSGHDDRNQTAPEKTQNCGRSLPSDRSLGFFKPYFFFS
jgi:hypothetical protein